MRYAKELSDKEKDEIWSDWKRLVNMTPKELEKWAENPDRLKASLNSQEANEAGNIQSGLDSLHRIKRRVKKKKSKWTADDWKHAKKTIGFNSRMLGNDPGKPVGDTGRSKWEISLRNWGHDPGKKGSPGRSKLMKWRKKHKRQASLASIAQRVAERYVEMVVPVHVQEVKVDGHPCKSGGPWCGGTCRCKSAREVARNYLAAALG